MLVFLKEGFELLDSLHFGFVDRDVADGSLDGSLVG